MNIFQQLKKLHDEYGLQDCEATVVNNGGKEEYVFTGER